MNATDIVRKLEFFVVTHPDLDLAEACAEFKAGLIKLQDDFYIAATAAEEKVAAVDAAAVAAGNAAIVAE